MRCEGQLPGPTAAMNSAGVLWGRLLASLSAKASLRWQRPLTERDTPPTAVALEGPNLKATGSPSPGLPGVRCDDQLPGPTAAVRRVRWVRRRLLASLRVSHCHCHWVAAAAQCGPAQGPRRAALLGESPRPGGPKRGSRPGQRALRPADSGALGPRAPQQGMSMSRPRPGLRAPSGHWQWQQKPTGAAGSLRARPAPEVRAWQAPASAASLKAPERTLTCSVLSIDRSCSLN